MNMNVISSITGMPLLADPNETENMVGWAPIGLLIQFRDSTVEQNGLNWNASNHLSEWWLHCSSFIKSIILIGYQGLHITHGSVYVFEVMVNVSA